VGGPADGAERALAAVDADDDLAGGDVLVGGCARRRGDPGVVVRACQWGERARCRHRDTSAEWFGPASPKVARLGRSREEPRAPESVVHRV
jgi:hypothetical protein